MIVELDLATQFCNIESIKKHFNKPLPGLNSLSVVIDL